MFLYRTCYSIVFICSGMLGDYCPGLCQEEWWVRMQSPHSLILYCMYILYVCVALKAMQGRKEREVAFHVNCMYELNKWLLNIMCRKKKCTLSGCVCVCKKVYICETEKDIMDDICCHHVKGQAQLCVSVLCLFGARLSWGAVCLRAQQKGLTRN